MHKLGLFIFGALLIFAKAMASLSLTSQQTVYLSYIASEAIVMEAFYILVTSLCVLLLKMLSILGKRVPSEHDKDLSAVISLFVTFLFFAYITIPPNIISFIAEIIA